MNQKILKSHHYRIFKIVIIFLKHKKRKDFIYLSVNCDKCFENSDFVNFSFCPFSKEKHIITR